MSGYMARRAMQAAILLVLVSVFTFAVIHSAPGGPAFLMNPDLSREDALRAMEQLGYLDPIHVQYARWVRSILSGNLGVSIERGQPVVKLIAERLPNSLYLMGFSLGWAVLLAIPIGVLSAVRRHSLMDYVATFISFFGVSIPTFWLGLMLIVIFSVSLGWFPSAGMSEYGVAFSITDRLRYLLLPAITLGGPAMAQITRYTRSSMVNVLHMDYVRTARAKGLRERTVLYRHALRNALIPVVTVVGLLLPRMVGGAAITESVFAWPGMGRLAVDSAFQRDYPLIMMIVLAISIVVILANLLVDFVYMLVDPRIHYN